MLSAYEEPVVVTECSVIIVDVTSWCVVGRDLKIPESHHVNSTKPRREGYSNTEENRPRE